MSTTSTRFQFKLADGNDPFDNDTFLKGNFNILDTKAAIKTETIAANGQNMEVVEVSFNSDGTIKTIQGTGTFTKTYTSPPVVSPCNLTQQINYSDNMSYPFVFSVTTTGFTVNVSTAGGANFGSGILKMKFLVFGS